MFEDQITKENCGSYPAYHSTTPYIGRKFAAPNYPELRRIDTTSSSLGMDGAVPGLVTEMPATAQAKRTASSGDNPRAKAAAKPPLKASPAPVVSTTGPALTAGTCSDCPLVWSKAPFSPKRNNRGANTHG